jgi:drug/metabolite transporter (DMT)-like permease
MAILLALAAAFSWGSSDFFAGLVSRRVAVPAVLLLGQGFSFLVIVVVALVTAAPFFDDSTNALYAAGAGACSLLGLGCFYRALAIGTMSVVAPISAAGVAVPVLVGVASGDRPSALAAVGLGAIVAGIIMASREAHDDEEKARSSRASIGLALLSALGFGGFFALTNPPSDDSVIWTLVLARSAAVPIIAAIALSQRVSFPGPKLAAPLMAVGCVELVATGLLSIANRHGDVSIVSVLASMYPVMTVLLAALVLKERLRRPQLLGVAAAMGGVALVAAG